MGVVSFRAISVRFRWPCRKEKPSLHNSVLTYLFSYLLIEQVRGEIDVGVEGAEDEAEEA